MKKIIVVLIVLGMLLVGCGQDFIPTEPTPDTELDTNGKVTKEGTPKVEKIKEDILEEDTPGVILSGEPPEDVTWISPGKVMVGNFYPGARAEWVLSVHNGNDTSASFAVVYRYPDHVEEGYSKPSQEVQDWVIVADTTPVLMPKETREVLIVLDIPKDVDRWSIPVWNLSGLGIITRDELRVAYQEDVEKATERGIEELPPKSELLLFLEGIQGVVVLPLEANSSYILTYLYQYLDYVIPTDEGKWEFWISVKDTTQGGMVRTELASRWLITMRD